MVVLWYVYLPYAVKTDGSGESNFSALNLFSEHALKEKSTEKFGSPLPPVLTAYGR